MSQDSDGEGKGGNLEEAAADAWEDAKRKNKGAGVYEIKKILVVTDNPIREYRVTIKKT